MVFLKKIEKGLAPLNTATALAKIIGSGFLVCALLMTREVVGYATPAMMLGFGLPGWSGGANILKHRTPCSRSRSGDCSAVLCAAPG